jgi:hypothetical protein
MHDSEIQNLLASLAQDAPPPMGLRERVLADTLGRNGRVKLQLSAVERFLFTRPLYAAASIALVVSCTLWAVLGGSFATLLSLWIG